MAVCLTVCYSGLEDPAEFARSYVTQHVPLGSEILAAAGLERWSFGPAVDTASNPTDPQFIANLFFAADLDKVQETLGSEAGQRLHSDALRIAGGPFKSYVTEARDLLDAAVAAQLAE